MCKEEVIIITKKNCPKCETAKTLGEKLRDKYKVKYLPIEEIDGLTEFTFHNGKYPPMIIYNNKAYNSVLLAQKELLGE